MRLLISGSPHPESSNSRLLASIPDLDATGEYRTAGYLADIPVFQPDRNHAPWPDTVLRWRKDLTEAEAVFICTPAYLHNIPGVLKNALDWLASSGELAGKRTLAMTFTPAPPRGDKAIQSLLWSLSALDANVLSSTQLYQSETNWTKTGKVGGGQTKEILLEMLGTLA